jgi:formate hydrogenlyase subunit 6/NADH:ubiquinone oxidoreductase subunit I
MSRNNLEGEQKNMVRILLRFPEALVEQPITSQIILELKVPVNIITAHVNSKGGEILAEIPDDAVDKTVKAFRAKGVEVSIPKLVEVNTDDCFSCGTCVSLCPVEAISINKDGSVVFDREKCVGSTCSICVDACPVRAIKSVKELGAIGKTTVKKKT